MSCFAILPLICYLKTQPIRLLSVILLLKFCAETNTDVYYLKLHLTTQTVFTLLFFKYARLVSFYLCFCSAFCRSTLNEFFL